MGIIQLTQFMERPSEFGWGFDTSVFIRTLVGAGPVELVEADSNRVSLVVSAFTGNTLLLSPADLANSARGFLVADTESFIAFTYDVWGPLVGRAWNVEATVGNVICTVATVSWRGTTRR